MQYRIVRYVLLFAAFACLHPGVAAETASETQSNSGLNAPFTTEANIGEEQFTIGPDDVLAVSVWKEPEISRALLVRADGRISLPLVGEIQAAGRTPQALEAEIRMKLKSYISEPEVTVMVQESRSRSFNILGEIARPGTYPISKRVTVLDAIAMAGGFRDFAKRKSIYVLRNASDGKQKRIPFNYKEATSGKNPELNVTLQPHDTIVVP